MTLDNRLPNDLVLKLFDTLKDSNSQLKTTVDKQTEAIVHLSNLMREGVKTADIKALIEKHNDTSGDHLNNIDTCTDTINDKSDSILEILTTISKKLNTTITVICVAFSLMILSYYFVRSNVDIIVDKKVKTTIDQVAKIPVVDQKLVDEIEKLRKELENLKQGVKDNANSKTVGIGN